MGWGVSLKGDASELERLAESFISDDFKISNTDRGYCLFSSRFEESVDARTVLDKSRDMIDNLNGMRRLTLDSPAPIEHGGVFFRHENGTFELFAFPSG